MSPVQRPTREQVTVFLSAIEFRAWLDANHGRKPELFVAYYRKGSGKTAQRRTSAMKSAFDRGKSGIEDRGNFRQ